MVRSRRLKKTLLWLALATLFAGLVIAGSMYENATDKNVQAASSIGADAIMADVTATTIKPAKPQANINWTRINQLDRQLKQNNAQYQSLVAKAGAEKQTNHGNVSDATRQQGLSSARQFADLSEQLATTYQQGNCISRAKTVRAAAKALLANAEMAFNSLSNDRINEYNDAQSALADANAESYKEIKADASPSDIAAMKANLIPRLNKMIADNGRLLGDITKLLDQIRQAAGGDVSAMAGCAKGLVSGAAEGGPAGLLRPVMSLLNAVKGLGSSLTASLQALTAL